MKRRVSLTHICHLIFKWNQSRDSRSDFTLHLTCSREWFSFSQNVQSVKLLFFSFITDSLAVDSPGLTVRSWPQLWEPVPHMWHIWTSARTTWRMQQWSWCALDWRAQTVEWRIWGEFVCIRLQFVSIRFESVSLASRWSSFLNHFFINVSESSSRLF